MTERKSDSLGLGLLGALLPLGIILPLYLPGALAMSIINSLYESRDKTISHNSMIIFLAAKLSFVGVEYGMYRLLLNRDKEYARSYKVGAIAGSVIAYGWDLLFIIYCLLIHGGPG